jgi:hypothetical protein
MAHEQKERSSGRTMFGAATTNSLKDMNCIGVRDERESAHTDSESECVAREYEAEVRSVATLFISFGSFRGHEETNERSGGGIDQQVCVTIQNWIVFIYSRFS